MSRVYFDLSIEEDAEIKGAIVFWNNDPTAKYTRIVLLSTDQARVASLAQQLGLPIPPPRVIPGPPIPPTPTPTPSPTPVTPYDPGPFHGNDEVTVTTDPMKFYWAMLHKNDAPAAMSAIWDGHYSAGTINDLSGASSYMWNPIARSIQEGTTEPCPQSGIALQSVQASGWAVQNSTGVWVWNLNANFLKQQARNMFQQLYGSRGDDPLLVGIKSWVGWYNGYVWAGPWYAPLALNGGPPSVYGYTN